MTQEDTLNSSDKLAQLSGIISSMVENAYEGIYLVDPENMVYLDVNPAGALALKYSQAEMVGMRVAGVHPDSMELMQKQFEGALRTGKTQVFTVYAQRKDLTRIFVEITLTRVEHEGRPCILAMGRNLSRWQKFQNQLEQLNRVYRLLTQVNRAIRKHSSQETLLAEVCEIVVIDGRFKMAWYGRLEGVSVVLQTAAGQGKDYARSLCITLDNKAFSQGPVVRAIEERSLVVVNDVEVSPGFSVWRDKALKHDFHSVAALPVMDNDNCQGVLVIYSELKNAFDDRMQDLLRTLEEDISNAIMHFNLLATRDIAEQRLRQLSSAVDQSADAVTIMNTQGEIQYVNPRFCELTGYSSEESIGQRLSFLCVNSEEADKLEAVLHDLAKGRKWRGEIRNCKKNGDPYWSMDTISPIRDERGEILQLVSTSEDYTALRQAQQKIEQLAFYDPLTALPNRRLLQDRLKQALNNAQRERSMVAVLYLDIDKFKGVNDSLGHLAGDQLLSEIARRLQAVVRQGDTVARLGGDEFTVVLTNVFHLSEAVHIAERILVEVSLPIKIGTNQIVTSTSIGITLFPFDGLEISDLLRNADMAMYHAKSQGRNNYQFYTDEMNQSALRQIEMEHKLRDAVDSAAFHLHYQPQVCIRSGKLVGFEALIRWECEGKFISPAEFIPIAEEAGFMERIGAWVLETACHDLHVLQREFAVPFSMAINISASQFKNTERLLVLLHKALQSANVAPQQVELELTESMLIENAETTMQFLKDIRALGVRLAIDDFGTGYSSLSYLKRFPINKLKIDRSFVMDIETDASDATIAVAIIALAHELGMEVLAEGVETQGQLEFLAANQCDVYQGYYYGKPMSLEDVKRFIIDRM